MFEYQRVLQPSRSSSASENEHNISSDSRKSNKPLLEKKRRARINRSLEQLKALLIDTIKNEHATGYSKLEKADILELAVKYLRNIRTQQLTVTSPAGDPKLGTARYQAGFTECVTEVERYLSSIEDLSPDTRRRLMSHLSTCIRHRHAPTNPAAVPPPSLMTSSQQLHRSASVTPSILGNMSFAQYDISMTSPPSLQSSFVGASTPFVGAGSSRRCGVVTSMPFRHVTASSLQLGQECWTPCSPRATFMDDSRQLFSADQIDESSRTNATTVRRDDLHDSDDENNELEGVATIWNSHVARDGRSTRPLAEKNNNAENIARNCMGLYHQLQYEQQQHSLVLVKTGDNQMLMDDDIKDEPVWRPW